MDIHNTLMTCCRTAEEAQARFNNGTMLPSFLLFNANMQVLPSEETSSWDPQLNEYLSTDANMLCVVSWGRPAEV